MSSEKKYTVREVANALRIGANRFERNHKLWTKGQLLNACKQMCAHGITCKVLTGTAGYIDNQNGVGIDNFNACARLVCDGIGNRKYNGLADFNDDPNTTIDMVITAMRRIARAVEHGGRLV